MMEVKDRLSEADAVTPCFQGLNKWHARRARIQDVWLNSCHLKAWALIEFVSKYM